MTETNNVPEWIESQLFENVLSASVPGFKEIKNFKAFNALPPGENYSTIILKIQIEVLLKNETTTTETFILKIAPNTDLYREQISKWQMFTIESGMYRQVVPELEQYYTAAGVDVSFSPKAYDLPIDKEYILLEDLTKRGFRNVKRQDCLDIQHCKSVLKKVAQWHAATAVRIDQKGPYDPNYHKGIANEVGYDLLRSAIESYAKYILKMSKSLKNHEIYYEQMEKISKVYTDILFRKAAVDLSDFNVLNHGDCWCNNIMFQYDDKGNLMETYLVDLQTPRYGTAAQDVLYFILSSAQLNLKINRFDEMIKYYYDHLVENLKLLKYSKPIPSLGDLHRMLLKAGVWSVFAAWNTLPAVLVDASDDATVDNLIGDGDNSHKFKELLYNNDRIKKQYEILLPWLYYRGAFDIE